MNEELVEKMQTAISGLPADKVASFHARFLAYLAADLVDDLRAVGDVSFCDYDAMALSAKMNVTRADTIAFLVEAARQGNERAQKALRDEFGMSA